MIDRLTFYHAFSVPPSPNLQYLAMLSRISRFLLLQMVESDSFGLMQSASGTNWPPLHSPTPLGMKLGGNFHFHFRARRAQNVQNVQTAIKLRPPRKSWKCLCCCGGVLRFERYWWAPWGNKRFLSKRAGFRRGPWLNWLSTRPSSLSAVLPNSLAGQNWKTQNSSQPNLVHK